MTDSQPLRLGFARGTAPSKWAKRWQQAGGQPLELVPLTVSFGRGHRPIVGGPVDVMLERSRPGELPEGAAGPEPTRHAVRLYVEAVALVVAADHELAGESSIDVADLALAAPLLDHPDHLSQWPAAEPWAEPSWRPKNAAAALALVATGAGAILLPLPLARQLSSRREHAVLPVTGDAELEGGIIWASWDLARDAADVQQLAGIMRGRTARSSRPAAESGDDAQAKPAKRQQPKPQAKKNAPKPGSRGAQLAAAKAKAERIKAEKRKAAKGKRR